MKSNIKKILSLVLMFIMVLSTAAPAYAATPWDTIFGWIQSENAALNTASAAAETGTYAQTRASGTTTYVLAGSDFQPTDSSNTTGVNLLNKILDKVDDKYTTMDGFIFAGDYDYQYKASQAGKEALQGAVQAIYGTEMDEVYIEGNHDDPDHGSNPDLIASGVFNPSGENDTDNYGVFAINHSDYMWYNSDETAIKNIAANLETYLNAKRNAGYTKPIFVVSHLPLHYCMRTKADGDGKHANYIFDVLNEAGAAGLNIIFMFGHNHSHGWDDPYGGAAIFLKKGDSINIAQNSTTNYNVETLNFTYMNAGYVSYYRNVNSGAETDLSMTVFAITGSDVTIERYTADGLHDLKSAGVANTHASTGTSVDGSCSSRHVSGAEPYSPDTTTVASGYVMTLNTEITPAGGESGGEGGDTESGTATSIEQVATLEQGVPYIIVCDRSGAVLTGTASGDDLQLSGTASVNTTDLWYYNGTNLIYGDPNSTSSYLRVGSGNASIGAMNGNQTVSNVFLNNDGSTFSIGTAGGQYLNQYGGSGATIAAGYSSDGNSDDGSKWVLYKVNLAEKELASFSANGVTVTTYGITGLNVTVETKTVDGYSAYKSY
ncbi:MAG: metallophosphoesterase, partial [Clostridia bacterium]|nr:metallophosphoesterase [Clostridia bacterium]